MSAAGATLREALLGADPLPWLLDSVEPAARWAALTQVLGRPVDDPEVRAAHQATLADAGTRDLLDRLPDWEVAEPLSGHDSPKYAPNLLALLADMGVGADDDARVSRILDRMLEHQDADGRFAALADWRRLPEPAWSALHCDTHAITETLLRFGRGDDPRVGRAMVAMAADVAETAQGPAWLCRPDPAVGFRGPGRKNDFCPQVALQALRSASFLPPGERPPWTADAARVSLRAWRERGSEHPYMFGHGRRFKRVKWPATWYNVLTVVDAVGRFPELWRGAEAHDEDAQAIAELGACLIAYNVDPAKGTVTPRSCYKGFESFSFGQKKEPSPFATARVLAALVRLDDLAESIAGVDVAALPSSKGGSGVALPP